MHGFHGLAAKTMTIINAQLRSLTGNGPARRLRKQDLIPAVVYGKGMENKNITVKRREVEQLLKTKLGANTFINLEVEGDQKYTVLLKDTQGNVLTRFLTHADFWIVKPEQEVEVNVAIHLTGKAPGLQQGGILEQISHRVKLLCRADSIPTELLVDVGTLEVNQNIHLADVALPSGITRRPTYNPTIVSVVKESAEAAPTTDAAATAATPAAATAAAGKDAKPAADAKKPDAKKK